MVMGTGTERERELAWRRANEGTIGTETRAATGRERGWGPDDEQKRMGNEDGCRSRTGCMWRVMGYLQAKPTGSSVVTVEARDRVTPGKKTNNSP